MKKFEGYMHGINLGGWLSQCSEYSEEHYSSFITEGDIKTISDWGLDHVRLPIDYNVIEDNVGLPLKNGYRHIDDCIKWCGKYGLNVILDLHKTKGFAFDDTSENNIMFDSPELQERFVSLWINLASRYGKKNGIAFELLNEIVEKDSSRWNALAAKTISAIRQYAPVTKIIIGGIQWNSVHTLKLLDIPDDKNIVYNFHFYEPFLFTHQRASWLSAVSDISMRYPDTMEIYRKVSQVGADCLQAVLEKLIKKSYVSAAQLYDYSRLDMAMFINDNNMGDQRKIFDMAEHLFSKEKYHDVHYSFQGKSHITRPQETVNSKLDIIMKYARDEGGFFSEEDLEKYLYTLSINNIHARQYMKLYTTPDFLFYEPGYIITTESINITSEWLGKVKRALNRLFSDVGDHITIRDIQPVWYNLLPDLPGEKLWTLLLLQSILRFYYNEVGEKTICALDTQSIETLHAMLVTLDSEIQTFSDLVSWAGCCPRNNSSAQKYFIIKRVKRSIM